MPALPDVTLCCVDTVNHALALRALERSRAGIEFARTVLLTHAMPPSIPGMGVEIVDIGPLASRTAYSDFMLKGLLAHVHTSHALVVQWDGFVVNPAAWDDAFLACDYLGAKWFWYDSMRVGNGGFSLRSRRLLEALQDPRVQLAEVEDLTICRTFRPLLEEAHGIRFGSEELADRFAFEAAYPIGKPFGFHGLFNFCRVLEAREIAALVPQFSDAIVRSLQLGQLLRNCAVLEQWEAVEAIAQRMLALDPQPGEARELLQRAREARSRPRVVGRNEPCPCGSGRKYKQCHGAIDGASTAAPAVVRESTRNVEASVQQALAAHQRGDLDAAERLYRSVLADVADHPVATHYLGVVTYQRGNPAAALPLLERSAATRPQEPEFHNNHGLALAALQRHEEAIVAYRRTLAIKADHAVAWNNLGLSLAALNRFAEAIAAYREAIARTPQFGQAHWNLALALLSTDAYEEGWREYEWRLRVQELGKRVAPPDVPAWDGPSRAGLRILLATEQGLGDTIQFARFAKLLAARGMHVVIEASPRWHALLQTVPGVKAVHSSDARDSGPVDVYLPLLSVPRALRLGARDIAAPPYVTAQPARRAAVRALMQGRGDALKVGVSWAGSAAHGYDARRSVTPQTLAPLLGLHGVAWYSLQKDTAAGAPWIELDARNDLDDTAALIGELDLVISVDTSIAHLAGAMGRPLWVILPFAADWRWGHDRADAPWYPSARLFRQPRPGDWPAVMQAVRAALERLASATR